VPEGAGSRLPAPGAAALRFAAKQTSHPHASFRAPVDAIGRIAMDRARGRRPNIGVAIPRNPRTTCGKGTQTGKPSAAGRRSRIATDRNSGRGNTDTAAVEPPERRLERPARSRPAVALRCRATLRPDTPLRRSQLPQQPRAQRSPTASFEIHYPSHPPRGASSTLARRGPPVGGPSM
jgi:hypothetical protein